MSEPLDLVSIARETGDGAFRLGAITWPWMIAYCASTALAGAYSIRGDIAVMLGMHGLVLVMACAWGVVMYQKLLRQPSDVLASPTIKLIGATFLVYLLIGLVAFIVGLAVVIISGVLIAASGFDPSAGAASDVDGSIAALRASGAIWIIYIMGAGCICLLTWFSLRLYLYGVATAIRRRVLVFQTWGLTQGHVFNIGILCLGAVVLPILVAEIASELTARQIGLPGRWALSAPAINNSVGATPPAMSLLAIQGGLAGLYHVPAILLGHSLAGALFRRLGDNATFE